MHLYLSQHGDALPESENPDRPLSEKGRKDVGRMASFLARSRLPLGSVVHSGKLRAQQTALIFSETLGAGRVVQECPYPIAPNDPIGALYKALQTASGLGEHVLIVGHLPFMNKLASRLVSGDESANSMAFEPGCVFALERPAGHSGWQITWALRPSLLGD